MSLASRLTDNVFLSLDGRDWRLVVTYGVLLDCQEQTGVDMLTSTEAFVRPSAKVLRALLWALLRTSDPSLTPESVGALMTPGRVLAIQQATVAAFLASMPEPPKKQPIRVGSLLAKRMSWMQTAAVARVELGLTEPELLGITPRYFHELREVSVDRMRREELLTGLICEVIVNFSQCRPKKPVKASDWIMHKSPEEDEPLDLGEKMLRELQKFEL